MNAPVQPVGVGEALPKSILKRPSMESGQDCNTQPWPLRFSDSHKGFPTNPEENHLSHKTPSWIPGLLRIPASSVLTQEVAPKRISEVRLGSPGPLPRSAARWPGTGPLTSASMGNAGKRIVHSAAQIPPGPAQTSPRPIARFFGDTPLQTGLPDFSRLDIPNEEGKRLLTTPDGGLAYHEFIEPYNDEQLGKAPSDAIPPQDSKVGPDGRLPNAQHDSYPMIIQLLGRPCILFRPQWDKDTGGLCSGDERYLSFQERQERLVCRIKAREDLQLYGSPIWLAEEPDIV